MELTYHGANCVKIVTKKAAIVVDDNLATIGLKQLTKPADISLRTQKNLFPEIKEVKFSAEMPGEYEISGFIIHGVSTRAHMDEEGKQTAVIYTVEADDIRVAILGHIYPQLSEEQLEQIGMVDIVIVPVGGNGYTLDGVGALKVIKQLEPKIVIPTHYADKNLKYEVPQQELSEALKGMAMEPSEKLDKFKVKPLEITDTTRLIVLERQ
jgi:L-ascorbate metabolism protein UlaG (beta-lactamase superfamily)